MGYSPEIHRLAAGELETRRARAVAASAALRKEMTARHPRLAGIENALADTGAKLSRAILSGGDIDAAIAAIKDENLHLQQEMADILQADGCAVKNFDPQYTCPACRDTGYTNGVACACLSRLLRELSAKQVCKGLMTCPTSFDDLDISFYEDTRPGGKGISPRERMCRIFEYCREYTANFDTSLPSLLLRGPTGTGKTHVSLAIAAGVAQNGFTVLYQPAGKLFTALEREHFGKQTGDTEGLALQCDLLVLDDLGTEFDTAFTNAALYNIINTRMLDGLPTIISTNLTQEGLQQRYGDQITSRITGAFEPLLFVGKDIRQQKRAQEMAHL